MNKIFFVLSVFLVLNIATQAQQFTPSINLRTGIDLAGLGFGYRFAQGGNVLKRGGEGYYGGNIAYHVSLQYRFSRIFAIEGGFTITEYDLGVHDLPYLQRYNLPIYPNNSVTGKAQPGWLGAYRYYYAPKLAFYQHIPLGSGAYLYVAEGFMLNYIFLPKPYQNSYSNGSETETLITQFKSFFPSGYIETGIHYNSGKSVNLYCGLKYIYADAMMQADYTDISNGTLINSDHVSANGSYFAFTFHIGGTLWHKEIKNHERKEYHSSQSRTKSVTPTVVPPEKRNVKVQNTMQVQSAEINIEVWDHESADGDVLSLQLNGEYILENYYLMQSKKIITVTLNPGENTLVMTAVNQGRYKPCTAAILVDDGRNKQTYILDSDFSESGSLIIKYTP